MGKIIIFIFFHFLLFPCLASAQFAIASAGSDFEGSGGKISFTVGQLAYSFYTSQTGSLTEGVQQIYLPGSVDIFEANDALKTAFLVYPNPVADLLILKSDMLSEARFTYRLFSPELKMVRTGILDPVTTTIDTEGIASGVHYLVISGKEGVVAEFRVVILSK